MKKNSESSFLNKLRLRVLAGFFLMLAVLVSFTGCAPQKDLVIKNGKKTIPERAYFDNKTLESVSMPDTVTSIGREAFRGCTSLMSVTLSEGLTEIGDRAFSSCRNLTSIVIPPSVKSIGFEAFKYCSSLTTVVLCEGLTEIGKGAFEGCNNLTSILIPDTVISVGSMAFYGCSSLFMPSADILSVIISEAYARSIPPAAASVSTFGIVSIALLVS